ncbi:MAG: hypothetical protein COW71_11695 [Ignavibacteriales bacterium CG18_big_fil_WC_8_21_14_2_50_31_20]|nr:MAG: hypothetical protein COW71_11695 [Ignavibacteriales bacterium CG18_big_fil_WC_8_21_14_2_50_31_20]
MNFIKSVILVLMFSTIVYGQTIVNQQQATTIWYYPDSQTSSDDPSTYSWSEETNLKQGVHVHVAPPERVSIYLQQNNSWLNFTRTGNGLMTQLRISYDGGSWQTIFNTTHEETGWIQTPFTTLGKHTIKVKWYDLAGSYYYRDYDVFIIPQPQKLYRTNNWNTITCWEGNGDKTPIIISEGFDPYSVSPAEFLFSTGETLFNDLLTKGYSIYIVNYVLNSQSLKNNAAVYNSASTYIGNLSSSNDMIAVGVSMGGLIVRYALAEAETNSTPLPFSKYVSVDSPQQGAIMSRELQDYLNKPTFSGFQKHGLNNTAARQMLNYSTYGSLKSQFFNDINALNNGTGYPSETKNIGVSFSDGSPNPSTGTWIKIVLDGTFPIIPIPFTNTTDISLISEEVVAGSYLPTYLGATDPSPYKYWGIVPFGMARSERVSNSNPTFIPYNSALDIVNNISKFDITIQANANYFHNEFPQEVVDDLVDALIPPSTPQSFQVSFPYYQSPTLSWTANAESDLDGYKVYKKYTTSNGTQTTSILTTNNSYTDYDFTANYKFGDDEVEYWVVAVDIYDNFSNETQHIGGDGTSNYQWKIANDETAENIIKTYELYSNYPNPFNPTTQISYQLPKDEFVNLVVYNSLGQLISTLVNQHQTSGKYSVKFDATSLPSGVYIYKIQAGEFSSVKKMLLTK